jgi:transposase
LKTKYEKENVILLFADPVHQIHNNENGYAWQKKGKAGTKKVLSNTGRRRLNIIGALNPLKISMTSLITEAKCDREVIKAFFKEIRKDYPEDIKINLILDNASYNKAYDVQKLAEELNISLIYLPPYSPNLNLIERIWKFFKKKITKNNYHPTFEEFNQAVNDFFKKFNNFCDELKSLLTFNFEIIKAS